MGMDRAGEMVPPAGDSRLGRLAGSDAPISIPVITTMTMTNPIGARKKSR
jgi:hypothetical protein